VFGKSKRIMTLKQITVEKRWSQVRGESLTERQPKGKKPSSDRRKRLLFTTAAVDLDHCTGPGDYGIAGKGGKRGEKCRHPRCQWGDDAKRPKVRPNGLSNSQVKRETVGDAAKIGKRFNRREMTPQALEKQTEKGEKYNRGFWLTDQTWGEKNCQMKKRQENQDGETPYQKKEECVGVTGNWGERLPITLDRGSGSAPDIVWAGKGQVLES